MTRNARSQWLGRVATVAALTVLASLLPAPVVSALTEPEPGTIASIDGSGGAGVAHAAAAPGSGDSGFGEKNRFVGRLGYSADGLGQRGTGGSLLADVPAGATVRLAYLYGSYFGFSPSQSARTIRFGGRDVLLTQIPSNAGSYLSAARADVTEQVTSVLGDGGGVRPFRVDSDPTGLDGVALLVVYEDPSLPVSTIAVIDGGAAQAGQRTTLTFSSPLEPDAPGFTARMSLGIGFGFQGGGPASDTCGTGARQSSIVDVNDRGLTSCAGNFDDGVGGNGGLITVGGVGDSLANPADPFQQPGDRKTPRVQDDELYDLAPFVRSGDRSLEIDSANPSFDDIIFLTVIAISARIETVTSVPIGQTFGTGGSAHGSNPTGYQADPVNSRTGFYVTATTDAVLPTRGPAVRLDRTYTSGDDSSSLFGRGWSSPWGVRLLPQGDDVTLVAEDGQRLVYERGLGGTLLPPSGGRSTLSAVSGGYELLRKDGVRYRFDDAGQLLSVRDERGLGFTLERSADGRLTGAVDDAGRRTAFTTRSDGLVTAITLPDGRTVGYGYDDGLLTSVTDVRGGTTRYGYDSGRRLVTLTDQNGVVLVTNSYGQDGRILAQVDANGDTSSFAWDEATLTSTMTDATGAQWRDVYDEDGRLARRLDPLGNATTFEWDADLNLVAVTDPGGDTTRMRYDGRGNLVEAVGPALGAAQFRYDATDTLTAVIDPNGGTTTFEHDADRNLVAVTGPLGSTTRLSYEDGLPVAIADRRGGTTRLGYDGHGNLVEAVAPSGAVTRYRHDASGRTTEILDASGRSTSYGYDNAGNLVMLRDGEGNELRVGYDAAGRRTSTTDGRGNIRRFEHDPAGRLVQVTAADSGTTSYRHDAAGRVVSRTDGNGHTTTYERDPAGRVTSVTLPTGEAWRLRYDADGNATEVLTPRGPVRLSYDALDRIVGIDYSDATPDVTMTYDGNGNRLSQTDGGGQRTFGYDAENRLVSVARDADRFGYTYDEAGNIVERSYPDGREIGYDYTPDGLLARVRDGAATTAYTYDATGRLTQTALPNGTSEARSYDAAGRLTGVVHRNAKGRSLDGAVAVLDAAGNPVSTSSASDGRTATYRYDAENRLVEECFAAACPAPSSGAARTTYDYDAVGNRIATTRPSGRTEHVYDASDRLVRTSGPEGNVNYTYDGNGNRTSAGTTTYSYDLANRLVRAEEPAEPAVDYSYDGDGLLRSMGGVDHLWDIASPSPLLAVTRGPGVTTGLTHGNDLISVGDHVAHQDVLGAVTSLTDSSGTVRASFEYDAFGALTQMSGRDADGGPVMGFAGMPRDGATGLVVLGARTYDPATGTFLQRDPVAAGMPLPTQSPYAWAGNRPTVLTDPTGQCPFCVLAGVGAVVGGVVGGAAYALTTDDFSWRELGGAAAGGAVAGAVGAVAGPLGGSIATGVFGASATGAAATAATVGVTAAGGALGTTTQTYLGSGRAPTAAELAVGAAASAAGGAFGNALFPTRGMTTIAQTRYFGPRTWAGLVSGKPNISALYRGAFTGGGLELGLSLFGNDLIAPAPSGAK